MSRFLTPLCVAMTNRKYNGRDLWRLSSDFIYQSRIAGLITVPNGFLTDFASVPRLPVVFWLTGDTAHRAAVIHDWLYKTGLKPRDIADRVLLEAMKVARMPLWRRQSMYLAVRLFGARNYHGRAK